MNAASREDRHEPAADPGWCEWWSFDSVSPDGTSGLFVRFALHPRLRRTSYWAGLVTEDGAYLLVRDDDLPMPKRSDGLEVRGSLWAACTCDAPDEQWTVGLESFAVEFAADSLLDAWGDERGHISALGLDLTWHDTDGADSPIEPVGYARWGLVDGELLTATSRTDVDGWPGLRRHVWGVPRAIGWSWGWRTADGLFAFDEHEAALPRRVDGLPRTDGRLEATAWAPVLATEPAGARVGRALGRSPNNEWIGWMETWIAQ